VQSGHIESSTIGNLAIQMAACRRDGSSPSLAEIGRRARELEAAKYE